MTPHFNQMDKHTFLQYKFNFNYLSEPSNKTRYFNKNILKIMVGFPLFRGATAPYVG